MCANDYFTSHSTSCKVPDPTETSKKLHGEKEVPSFEIMTQTLDRKHLPSLKKGGAGESGVCYEAGASVEVAPVDALLTSPLATAAPAKPEALPAVPREDERRTRERDEGNAQRDVEEHEVEEEEG